MSFNLFNLLVFLDYILETEFISFLVHKFSQLYLIGCLIFYLELYFNIYCFISRSFTWLLKSDYSLIVFSSFSFIKHCFLKVMCLIFSISELILILLICWLLFLLVPTCISLFPFMFCEFLTLSRSFFLRPGLKLNSYRDLHLILPVAWRSVWITQVVWNHISNALQEPVRIIKIQRKIFPFIQSWTSDRKKFPISPLCSNVFLA